MPNLIELWKSIKTGQTIRGTLIDLNVCYSSCFNDNVECSSLIFLLIEFNALTGNQTNLTFNRFFERKGKRKMINVIHSKVIPYFVQTHTQKSLTQRNAQQYRLWHLIFCELKSLWQIRSQPKQMITALVI